MYKRKKMEMSAIVYEVHWCFYLENYSIEYFSHQSQDWSNDNWINLLTIHLLVLRAGGIIDLGIYFLLFVFKMSPLLLLIWFHCIWCNYAWVLIWRFLCTYRLLFTVKYWMNIVLLNIILLQFISTNFCHHEFKKILLR